MIYTIITGLLILGFIANLIYIPINRFITDTDSIDEYSSKEEGWLAYIYSIGYEIDKKSLSISLVALAIIGYFYYSDSLTPILTVLLVAFAFVSARLVSNILSLSKHKKVKYKKYYVKHNFWLYLDAVFSVVPFLALLTRIGFQKRLIFNYVMAVDSFEIYVKYVSVFKGSDKEKIKERMVELIPLYQNYFKVMSKKMGNNGDAVIKLLEHMRESGSLSVQFLPKSNNFLSSTFKEYASMRPNSVGVCDTGISVVAAPYFTKEFEETREDVFGKIIKSTFQDIFGIELIQLTYAQSEIKLIVEYTLIDSLSTFSKKNLPSRCSVAPSILWDIRLQSSTETFFQTQIVSSPADSIMNTGTADFYNKVAQTHYINLSTKLLSEFGISIEKRAETSITKEGLSDEQRESLLESIEDNVSEYGEDFLEVAAEEFYNQNEELIGTLFMASSLRLAVKHGDYMDIASGMAIDSVGFDFDIGLDSLWD